MSFDSGAVPRSAAMLDLRRAGPVSGASGGFGRLFAAPLIQPPRLRPEPTRDGKQCPPVEPVKSPVFH